MIEMAEDELEGYNRRVEETRAEDFPQLKDSCYLDHAGAGLYSAAQLEEVFEDLRENLLGNPHSQSAPSRQSADRIDEARALVANFFGVTLEDYSVIFTAGCTASLQLLAHSFVPNDSRVTFLFPRELHTSAVGIREIFRQRGATVRCLATAEEMPDAVTEAATSCATPHQLLCCLSGQCNFSGAKLDPLLARKTRDALGDRGFLLLDAAALVSCGPIDLEAWSLPDFVTTSFYKIFGYPTGLGALLVRNKSAESVLQKVFFGGGTQDAYLPESDFHRDRPSLTARLEDGTVSFASIAALKFGFEALNTYSSEDNWIARHVFALVKFLRRRLRFLRHANGAPVVALYVAPGADSWRRQGGILTFNVLRDDGSHIGYSQVARISELYHIHLRVGCFCNIGACQNHLALSDSTVLANLSAGHVCGDGLAVIGGQPTGAVRASFGYSSTKADAERLVRLIEECFRSPAEVPTTATLPEPATEVSAPTLERICVFPIKSCAPFCPRSWPMSATGLLHDREFLIADHRGAAITLSQHRGLSRIRPHLDLDRNVMTLSAEDHPDLLVSLAPVEPRKGKDGGAKRCQGRVCSVTLRMSDCGEEAASWVSAVLEKEGCRLLRQDENRSSKWNAGEISLNNEAQLLVINMATVRQLQEILPEEIEEANLSDRFRANLFIDHLTPLSEDELMTLRVGNEVFKAVGPCARCAIICVNPETEEKTKEPMRTIMKTKKKLTFGTYFMRCDLRPAELSLDQCISLTFPDNEGS